MINFRRILTAAACCGLLLSHARDASASLPTTRTDICYQGGALLPNFALNGNATLNGTDLLVTQDSGALNSSTFYEAPLSSSADIHVQMELKITTDVGGGADGMAFVMSTDPRGYHAIGDPGKGIGYGIGDNGPGNQIAPSVVVEMDTYQNSFDSNANHIALTKDGDPSNHLVQAQPSFTMRTVGSPFYVWVDYTASNTTFAVYVSQTSTKPGTALWTYNQLSLATYFNNAKFYMGFTGSTGGSWSQHEILSFIASDTVATSSVCCSSDTDCASSSLGSICDPVKHVCSQCQLSDVSKCAAGKQACDISPAGNVCIPPCGGDYRSGSTGACTAPNAGACVTSGPTQGSCIACDGNSGSGAIYACGPGAPTCSFEKGYCVYCASTSDCGGLSCDTSTGACGSCKGSHGAGTSSDCGASLPFCNVALGYCTAACQKDTDCTGSQICTTQGTCKAKAANTQPVPDGTCNTTTEAHCISGACNVQSGNCAVPPGGTCTPGVAQACSAGVCLASGKCGCASDTDCASSTGTTVCDTTTNLCAQCTVANHSACPAAMPGCGNDVCAACTTNAGSTTGSACPSTAPFCTVGTGACHTSCQQDSDCSSGQWCAGTGSSNGCISKTANSLPIPGSSCTTSFGAERCASGICDPADGLCGLATNDGTCTSSGQCRVGVCGANGKCGCSTDTDCASQAGNTVCNTTANACVQCTSTEHAACSGTTPVCNGVQVCDRCSANFGAPGGACDATLPYCNTTLGTCNATCQQDSDCGSGNWCSVSGGTSSCQPIGKNGDSVAGGCTSPAVGSRACVSGACDPADERCGFAPGDGTCTASNECRSGVCIQTAGLQFQKCEACAIDGDCPMVSNGSVCDPSSNQCVQCTINEASNCMGQSPVCTNDACAACTGNQGAGTASDCGGTFPFCNLTVGSLTFGSCNATCQQDSDCSSGNWCSFSGSTSSCVPRTPNGQPIPGGSCSSMLAAERCVSGVCGADGNCGFGPGGGTCTASEQCRTGVCVTRGTQNVGTCQDCAGDRDCNEAGVCDPSTNKCVQCIATESAACTGSTPICASDVCTACGGDSGAATGTNLCPLMANPFCDVTGACHPCGSNSDCRTGTHAGPICDLATGACGASCQVDTDCQAGSWCDNPTAAAGAGTCTSKVPNGQPLPGAAPINSLCNAENAARTCLGGICDQGGDNLCGEPGSRSCTADAQCRAGVCEMPSGTCGKYNNDACTKGVECRSGVCAPDGHCGEPSPGTCTDNRTCRSGVCASDGQCGKYNGDPCAAANDCRSGVCSADGKCGLPPGGTCTTANTCRTGTCAGGMCAAVCLMDGDCASGTFCSAGSCVPDLPNGMGCMHGTQCTSGVCNADGSCGNPPGTSCTTATTCRSGICDGAGKCGTGCTADAQCSTGSYCLAGSCTPGLPNGKPCSAATQCVSGLCGADGLCGQPNQDPCTAATDCRSQVCDPSGTCVPSCHQNSDCAAGAYCDRGTCKPGAPNGGMPGNMGCTSATQCASGVCDADGSCGLPPGKTCGNPQECRSGVCDSADGKCGYGPGDGPCTSENANTVCRAGVCDADGKCGYGPGDGSCTPETGMIVCRSGICDADGKCALAPGNGPCTAVNAATVCRDGVCGSDGKCGLADGDGSCTQINQATVCRSGVCDPDGFCGLAPGSGPCVPSNAATICRDHLCGSDGKCGLAKGDGTCTATSAGSVCRDQVCGSDGKCGLANGEGSCTAANAATVCRDGSCDTDSRCGLANGDGPCTTADAATICRAGLCGSDGKCGQPNGTGSCTTANAATVCRAGVCDADGQCGLGNGANGCNAANAAAVCRSGLCNPNGTCVVNAQANFSGGGCSSTSGSGSWIALGVLMLLVLWQRSRRRAARRG
jgi:uncharacterized protein (TIGR03382 family)